MCYKSSGDSMNDTKKKIIQVALKKFKDKGYDDVSINEICKDSDISKNTFYYYFKSKEELLHFNLKDSICCFDSDFLIKLMKIENPYLRYCELIRPFLIKVENDGPTVLKNFMIEKFNKDLLSGKFPHDGKLDFLKKARSEILLEAQNKGYIRKDETVEKLLRYSSSLMIGMMQSWVISDGSFDLSNEFFNAQRLLFAANEGTK